MAAQPTDYCGDGDQSVLAELERLNEMPRSVPVDTTLFVDAESKHVPSKGGTSRTRPPRLPPDDMPSSFFSIHSLTHVAQCELQA